MTKQNVFHFVFRIYVFTTIVFTLYLMRLFSLLTAFLLCLSGLFAENQFTVSGYVKDSLTGEALASALIWNTSNSNEGTLSNDYGFFSLSTAQAMSEITVSYIGYRTKSVKVENGSFTILLAPAILKTDEVIVQDDVAEKNVVKNEMSRAKLDIQTIKKLPVLFGEVDVLKSITLMPGVKQGSEGSSGLFVRGGGPDQNLILLDDAPVYNPSHLASFLSAFNGDMVKNIEVIKGGMPAEYGGRLSSIVKVAMRDGNNQKFAGSGGIGLLSGRFTFEGPIVKNKSSFIISARRSFIDAATLFAPKDYKGNTYYFYDLNFKANYILNTKNRLYLSGYMGQDVLKVNIPIGIKVGINYGNKLAALRWNHLFNDKLFCNTTLSYYKYNIDYNATFGVNSTKIVSGIQDMIVRHDYQYFPSSKAIIRWGGQYNFHTFSPGIASGEQSSQPIATNIPKQYAHEGALYASADWNVTERWALTGGLRYSMFSLVGPYTQKIYDNNYQVIDTMTYEKGKSVANYGGFEPRFSTTYRINKRSSVKSAYTRTYQYVQLATVTGAIAPTDVWIPSSKVAKPQFADQFNVGYFRNYADNGFETSIELYYKNMHNLITFRPGMPLVFNTDLDAYTLVGKGKSYGVEFLVKKNTGKTTGWIGYTWSKTIHQFDALNEGKAFFSRYDRRHDISVTMNHVFSEKWAGSLVFIYSSGNWITLPTKRFDYYTSFGGTTSPLTVDYYAQVNNVQAPAYHRGDISFTYTPKPKKERKYKSNWVFGVYNFYNQLNPYFVYLDTDKTTNKPVAKKLAIFPAIPSVSWNFTF